MNSKYNVSYLKELYEGLDVSESAKRRFYKEYLKEAEATVQTGGNSETKKAGIIHKFLSWLNKGTPTVESSTQKILESLAGMERIVQTSPMGDEERKKRDLEYLAKFKAQVEKSTKDILNANKMYEDAQSKFKPEVIQAKANEMAQTEAESEKELETFSQRIEAGKANPEELEKIKVELNQKMDEAKKIDEEAGDEYQELIAKIDEIVQNPEAVDEPDNTEDGATVEEPITGEEVEQANNSTEEPDTSDKEKPVDDKDQKIKDNETGKTGNRKDLNDSEEEDLFMESVKK